MDEPGGSVWGGHERREHIRVPATLDVQYKFLSHSVDLGEAGDEIFVGRTLNLSVGGVLMRAPVPEPGWIEGLLARTIVVGLNIFLPQGSDPVKVLGRIAWLEASKDETYTMGIEFREIASDSLDAIKRFIIQKSLPEA